jgi:drug/metabolite transporter (DMT)-like permease
LFGELAALGAALLISISSTVTAHLSRRLGAFTLIAWRALFGAIVYLALFAALGRWPALLNMPPASVLGFLGDALVAPIIASSLFIASLRHIDLSIAMPVSSTYPFFATLIAIIFFQEAISWYLLAAMPLILTGIWLLASPDKRHPPDTNATLKRPHTSTARGVALALSAAIAWGVAANILKVAVQGADLMAGTLLENTIVTITAFALAGPRRSIPQLRELNRRSLSLLPLSGILMSCFAPLLYFYAVRQAGVARTSVLGSTSPVFALPLALVFLNERITPRRIAGIALCTAGAVLAFL